MTTIDYYTKKSFVKRKDGTTAQMVWDCNFCEYETPSFWNAIKHARKHKKEIDEMTLKDEVEK